MPVDDAERRLLKQRVRDTSPWPIPAGVGADPILRVNWGQTPTARSTPLKMGSDPWPIIEYELQRHGQGSDPYRPSAPLKMNWVRPVADHRV